MYDNLVSFIFSFSFVTVLIAYIIKLPYLLTGDKNIVNEYYGKNFSKSFILDFFLFGIYTIIAMSVIKLLDITNYYYKVLTVSLVTAIISGAFYIYFITKPKTPDFFSRWFHSANFKAVLYDMVLITTNYIVYTNLLHSATIKKII
jgi:hypothetical protein